MTSLPAHADTDGVAGERARLSAERAQVTATFDAQQQQCRAQFIVARCLERANQVRREALERIGSQEAVLNDTERRRKAAERLERIEEKQRRLALRPEPASAPTPAPPDPVHAGLPSAASAPPGRSKSLAKPQRRLDKAADTPIDSERAEAAYAKRQQAAAAHREEVEQRNAARRAKRPAAAPLPVPAEPSQP